MNLVEDPKLTDTFFVGFVNVALTCWLSAAWGGTLGVHCLTDEWINYTREHSCGNCECVRETSTANWLCGTEDPQTKH